MLFPFSPQRGMRQSEAYYAAAARYNGGREQYGEEHGYGGHWWE